MTSKSKGAIYPSESFESAHACCEGMMEVGAGSQNTGHYDQVRPRDLKEKVPAALTELRRMSIRKDAEMRGRREKMYLFFMFINDELFIL